VYRAYTERRPCAVLLGLVDMGSRPTEKTRTHCVEAVPYSGEHKHPAAPHLELVACSEVTEDRVEQVSRQDDQRHADDPFHDRVDPVRQKPRSQDGQ
jgi:hypothetical protein